MAAEFTVSFTDAAYADLDDILQYLEGSLANPEAARRFLLHLKEAVSVLQKFPLSGNLVENPFVKRNDFRKTIVDHYVVYYFPDPFQQTIIILRIVYGKRDRSRIEPELSL